MDKTLSCMVLGGIAGAAVGASLAEDDDLGIGCVFGIIFGGFVGTVIGAVLGSWWASK